MCVVLSSRFLGDFGAVQDFFQFSSSYRSYIERGKVGDSNGRQAHTTRLDHAYLGKIVKPWDSASAGQSWNTILSFYNSRSEIGASRTTLEPGKHQLLAILNALLQQEYHTSVTTPVRVNGQGQ